MKRTFIAIKVEAGPELSGIFGTLKSDLGGEAVRWVDIHKLHLTLAFLGDTSETVIKEVSAGLRDICDYFDRFEFAITGLGVFKNINDPKVIWAGIEHSEKLKELSDRIKVCLDSLEIITDEREFSPHLTIARVKWIKNRKALEEAISKYSEKQFQKVKVNEVVFFESILQQTGPLYIPIKVVPLGSKLLSR